MTLRTLADGSVQHDNNFNLIRLVAAWLVIYGHSWPVTASGGADLLLQVVQIKFAGGIAVDMFFVISGFLIACSVERNPLPQYLVARALRIFPALIVCVALSVFVLGPLLTTAPDYWSSAGTWKYLWKNITLRQTQYFLPGVFETLPSAAINGSLWSLPIEFKLYLLLAFLAFARLFRRGRFTVFCLVALVAAIVRYGGESLTPEKSNLLWCTAYFLTGSLAWHHRARIPLSWPLLVGLLVGAAALRGGPYYFIAYFVALSYTTLFLAYVPKLPAIRRHDISYGVYLYGWPSQQLVQQFSPGSALHNTLWATLLAGTLAALSWRLVEEPALRLKHRFGARLGRRTPSTTPGTSPETAPEPATAAASPVAADG
ncbi:acyltransferase [Lysobacter arenosi]|uniref:Acyltransferase n=1 Tax=Lysobacter arenosi TaxID=2795387 RepID=A0ABX7RE93_9GAMM|nr:acyltransferase [Lysobacter arenosi]QSX75267.1 acyltransferase [Lysobacter arenosi]